MSEQFDDYVDLGYANGWHGENPAEYVACKDLGHEFICEETASCRDIRYCPICKIYYKTDSR